MFLETFSFLQKNDLFTSYHFFIKKTPFYFYIVDFLPQPIEKIKKKQ